MGKFFTTLDCKLGYWAIVLEEWSSFLTTLNTALERYRFLCLPFGVVSNKDVFSSCVDNLFEASQVAIRLWMI